MKSITLDRGDFFELVASVRRVETLRAELALKEQEAAAAGQRGQALFSALAEKYKFDPAGNYRFDEATCALVRDGVGVISPTGVRSAP